MLSRIFIQNFALIDSLEITLNKGLQVITGETGAGKSIILGALRLILGERADVKSIQNSETKSIVEAEFVVNENFKSFFDENDLDFEINTVIRREILPTGKSRAFVNDVPVTLEILKKLSEKLIDIHSQFETSNLFDEEYQFRMIDGLSKNKTLIVNYQEDFSTYKKLVKELENYKTQLSEGNKESDYKVFLLEELQEVNLDLFDLEEAQNQLSKQENAETIIENLSLIFNKMDAEEIGVLDSLLDAKNKLSKVASLSHEYSRLNQRLEEQFVEFKDFLFDLQNEADKMETNPEVLSDLSLQVNKINSLFLKHKVNSVEELIEIRDEIQNEQTGFAELEFLIDQTEKKIAVASEHLEKSANQLSENRQKAIPNFIKKTEKLLNQLGLEKAKIEVQLTDLQHFTPFGKENIQLLFQANSGFPLKPIQTAISGGERSRVMLSIKKLMAENAELPTLILDEIDTGVSGKVAEEIGNVMKEMSENMQLIVISHLAQVAAKGNDNYKVIKREVSGKTQSTIISLNQDEKLQEIAQLLSGSKITEAAISQAKELMK
ncbi:MULTISPECIES: DNA repair protein RecN [unclassified Kaistella]|uniref:DNA repair protein RecN n=1 Tax=unclassified Kaistella TaxID=2762626 RepID=UPI0027349D6E|nr:MULTISPECIES: DNA repair protein RecN [unclassified Kaistella]MDP2452840.1 DNA repair protein RecN [Kaistella sp. SH11-4b]MDP2455749.1 DNA repair protein RecN [Kaistella sp. SH40-3]MDP2458653.1 DNA repair protein RecN [Kaistella sp. SH19-2b]